LTAVRWGWVALAFLLTPIVEIYVIVQVGEAIGAWQTVALLLIESAIGVWLLKREGRRAWQELRLALNQARVPAKELADAALVLVGGTLLVTPGFVTDVVGFFCVLPFTRPLARRMLLAYIARRVSRGTLHVVSGSQSPFRPRSAPVVDGEVVEEGRVASSGENDATRRS
jgi:UPF0716 protein FxsA